MLNLGSYNCSCGKHFKLIHLREYIEEWERAYALFHLLLAFSGSTYLHLVRFREKNNRNDPIHPDKLIKYRRMPTIFGIEAI